MTRQLQIVMPMAGAGSRFANAGFDTPKPLIRVDDIPMFLKAISSLDNIKIQKKYIFILRDEHNRTQNLGQLIIESLPEAIIVAIPEITRGATETALMAKSYLELNNPVIIMDCDLWFQSESYKMMVDSVLNGDDSISAGLLTFEATDPRYSYATISSNGVVSEVVEKKVISNHAIAGAYFFTSANIFINAANTLLSRVLDDKTPEYFISLLYNVLLDEGKKIRATYVDEYASFGTPEELETYNKTKELL